MAGKRRNHISQRQPRDELGRFSLASTTTGPSSRRPSATSPSSTRRPSATSPSSTRRPSATSPSSTRRASTTAGPSSTRRASTTAGPSTTRRASSTKGPSSTRRTSTKTPAAMDTGKGAGAKNWMNVTPNREGTKVQISFDKLDLTMFYTDDSDNEGQLLRGKQVRVLIFLTRCIFVKCQIKAKVEELRHAIKQYVKYQRAMGREVQEA